jgi:hypothetical protein
MPNSYSTYSTYGDYNIEHFQPYRFQLPQQPQQPQIRQFLEEPLPVCPTNYTLMNNVCVSVINPTAGNQCNANFTFNNTTKKCEKYTIN